MTAAAQDRKADLEKVHAVGKQPVRLKVNPKGADLREYITDKQGIRSLRQFKAGEVFDHPSPERAAQLLEIGLPDHPIVFAAAGEKTSAEIKAEKEGEKVEEDLVTDELRAKARKIIQARKDKLATLRKSLEKMPAEVLKLEAEKRGLKASDDLASTIAAIVEIEEEELRKA